MERVYYYILNFKEDLFDWNAYPEDIAFRRRNMVVCVVVLFFLIIVFIPLGFCMTKF